MGGGGDLGVQMTAVGLCTDTESRVAKARASLTTQDWGRGRSTHHQVSIVYNRASDQKHYLPGFACFG